MHCASQEQNQGDQALEWVRSVPCCGSDRAESDLYCDSDEVEAHHLHHAGEPAHMNGYGSFSDQSGQAQRGEIGGQGGEGGRHSVLAGVGLEHHRVRAGRVTAALQTYRPAGGGVVVEGWGM